MKPVDGHSIDVVRIRQCYYDYDFLSTSRDVWVDRLPKMFFFFFLLQSQLAPTGHVLAGHV